MQVSDVMEHSIETIGPDASLQEAARKMKKLQVHLLPVGTTKGLIGIVTDRDITVRATAEGLDPTRTCVDEAMSLGVLACSPDQQLDEAMSLMRSQHITALLVLDNDKTPVGTLSLELLQTVPSKATVVSGPNQSARHHKHSG